MIIAAYNEEAVIERKLTETLDLDYPSIDIQIIVAADGSDDATAEIARRFAYRGVEVLHRHERLGKMAALERAVPFARGDLLVFSDANNTYRADTLREIARPFTDPTVGAVTGRKTVRADDGLGYSEGLYWRYESAIRRWETRLGVCTGVNGELLALRRELFTQAPADIINDDAWLAHGVIRRGYRVVYAPDAVSVEDVSATATDEVKRRSRMVAGQWQLLARAHRVLQWRRPVVAWQIMSHKLLRPLVPFGMMAAVGANIASVTGPGQGSGWAGIWALASPWNWVLLAAQAAFYTVAAAGPRLGGRMARLAYVPRFLVDSNIAALRGLGGFLRRQQGPTWERVARRDEHERTLAR